MNLPEGETQPVESLDRQTYVYFLNDAQKPSCMGTFSVHICISLHYNFI